MKNLKKISCAVLLVLCIGGGLALEVKAGTTQYVPLANIGNNASNVTFTGTSSDLSNYIDNMYKLAVGIAGVLAVLMIMWGGIEYMSTDAIGGKEEAKGRINNALLGLMIALGSYLLLKTINVQLLSNRLDITAVTAPELAKPIIDTSTFATAQNVSGGRSGASSAEYLDSIKGDGSGNTTLTAYGYKGDSTPDTNSSEARGNKNNLLTSGSVALSPDLIRSLNPKAGAAVYVGNTKVGYYDDSTAESYKGRALTGRVDIYDPSAKLGGNNFSKKINGAVRIDNSDVRAQKANPSKK